MSSICLRWRTLQTGFSVDRIFVYIAAVRERYLPLTIKSALHNADLADRVFFGVFNTVISDEDFITDPEILGWVKSGRVCLVEAKTAGPLGIGISRMVSSMLQPIETEYSLQVDAHTIFDKGWDSKLIATLSEIEETTKSNKVVLSGCPLPWIEDKDDDSKCLLMFEHEVDPYNFDSSASDMPTMWGRPLSNGKTRLLMQEDSDQRYPEVYGDYPPELDYEKSPGVFAAFMFFRTKHIRDFLHDPYNTFDGDQLNYSLRLISRGFDIYTPRQPVFLSKNKFRDGKLIDGDRDWRSAEESPSHKTAAVTQEQQQDDIIRGRYFGYWGAPDESSLARAIDKMGLSEYLKIERADNEAN